MKTILTLVLFASLAHGQYVTEYGRPLDGMSFSPPPRKSLPPLLIYMEGIDPASQRFTKILEQVRVRRDGLTVEKFTRHLQQGGSFTINVPVKQTGCPDCSGWGKISDPQAKTPDRKSPCNSCKGTGKTPGTRECHIRWKNPEP
jgi:hypothetical protein